MISVSKLSNMSNYVREMYIRETFSTQADKANKLSAKRQTIVCLTARRVVDREVLDNPTATMKYAWEADVKCVYTTWHM